MTRVERIPVCTTKGCPAPRDPDFHKCWCGQDKIEHHHVESRGMGGSKLEKNVVALCHTHHEAVTLHECYDLVTDFAWGKAYTYTDTKGTVLHERVLEAGSAAAEGSAVNDSPTGTALQRGGISASPSAAVPPASSESIEEGGAEAASGKSSVAEPLGEGALPSPVRDSRLVPSPSATPPPFNLTGWCQEGMKLVYLGLSIRDATDGLRFAIGDWFNNGEGILSDEVYGYLRGFKDVTVRQYSWVAGRVPREYRVTELDWSHHRAVAAEEPPQQKKWLAKALKEHLSSKGLYQAIHGQKPRTKRWLISEIKERFDIYITIDPNGGPPDVLEFLGWLETG